MKDLTWEEERLMRELATITSTELETASGQTYKIIQYLYDQEVIGMQTSRAKSKYRSVNRFLTMHHYVDLLRQNEGAVNKTQVMLSDRYGVSLNQIYKDIKSLFNAD